MIEKCGCSIVHLSELYGKEHTTDGANISRAKTYWHDAENNLRMQFIDQPANSVAPRNVSGTHTASVLLNGCALTDGLTLNALDVILDAGSSARGQIEYPEGCQLFSCVQGGNEHAATQTAAAEMHSRIIQSEQMPWDAKAGGRLHMKVLVDRGAGRLMLTAMRLSAGFTVPVGSRPHMQAALVVEGSAVVGDEILGARDFMYMAAGVPHGPIGFPDGATLLMIAMRPA
jgi:hypothetical protein